MNAQYIERIMEAVKTDVDEFFFNTPRYYADTEELVEKVIKKALSSLWVSVDESMPPQNEVVIAHFEDEGEAGECFATRNEIENKENNITDWMAIPRIGGTK